MELTMLFIKLSAYGIGLAIVGAIPLTLIVLIMYNYYCKKETGENIF